MRVPAARDEDLIDCIIRLPRALVEQSIVEAQQRVTQGADRRTALAGLVLAGRRRRRRLLPDMVLSDTSWDLILDLYLVARRGERVDVSSLCVATGAAPTTALRQLDALIARGLAQREPDPHDRRRINVVMTPNLGATVDAWLDGELTALAPVGWTTAPQPASFDRCVPRITPGAVYPRSSGAEDGRASCRSSSR